MKKVLFYIFIAIATLGLIMNLGSIFELIFRMVISVIIFGIIIYAIYYFFILSEDERNYRKAVRQAKKKRKFRK